MPRHVPIQFRRAIPYSYEHPIAIPTSSTVPYYMHPQMPPTYGQQLPPFMYNEQIVSSKHQNYLFQNPLEPEDHYFYQQFTKQGATESMYPKPSIPMKTTSKQYGSLLNSFKGQDGSLDLNKMVNTAGQLVNAINQVSHMAKGIGGIFKV